MPGAAAFLRDLRKSYPLSLATLASSPKGTPLRYAGNFPATAKSRPLGEGGCERSEQTEGVLRQSLQQAVYRLIYQFAAFCGRD